MPALCAKAESPTNGWCCHGGRFASSEAKRARSRSSRRLTSGIDWSPSLSVRFGMIDTRFAFPHRSPKPFSVPWTCSAPSRTAASEFATAHSPSLWAWIPSGASTCRRASRTISATSEGSVPPFVSQSTRTRAPARSATRRVSSAYSGSRLNPSKKCSAS